MSDSLGQLELILDGSDQKRCNPNHFKRKGDLLSPLTMKFKVQSPKFKLWVQSPKAWSPSTSQPCLILVGSNLNSSLRKPRWLSAPPGSYRPTSKREKERVHLFGNPSNNLHIGWWDVSSGFGSRAHPRPIPELGILFPDSHAWVTCLCLQQFMDHSEGGVAVSPKHRALLPEEGGRNWGNKKIAVSIKLPFSATSTSFLFLEPKSTHSLFSTNIFVFSLCPSRRTTTKSLWGRQNCSKQKLLKVARCCPWIWICISQGGHSLSTPVAHRITQDEEGFSNRCLGVSPTLSSDPGGLGGTLHVTQSPPPLWLVEQPRRDSFVFTCWQVREQDTSHN